IVDLIKKFNSIPQRLEEEYHSIKDDALLVSVYTTGNVTVKGMLIPNDLLTDDIRETQAYKDYAKKTSRATRTPNPAAVNDVVSKKKKGKCVAGETSLPILSLKVRI
ncbi:hypothetical protein Tco_1208297, partial [Tanacetum coccineum]